MKHRIEFTLKQHTPMIHFQHDQPGATLRATELKPKLDRFLIEYYGMIDESKKPKTQFKKFFLDYSSSRKNTNYRLSLNYKVRIIPFGNPKITLPNKMLYFANNALRNQQKIKATKYPRIDVEIKSPFPELIRQITESLDLFFFTHNFGARQSKGYGGFFPEKSDYNDTVEKLADKLYEIKPPTNQWGRRIDEIHKRLKSGINHNGYHKSLLFKYMCRTPINIRWEKRWIKQTFPEVTRKNHRKPIDCEINHDDNFKFIRALLGLPSHFEFNKGPKNGGETITIKHDSIKRFKSPVTYKVFGERIFLLPDKSYMKMFDKTFSFTLQKPNAKKKLEDIRQASLQTPPAKLDIEGEPESFDIFDFLDWVCEDNEGKKLIQKVNS